MIIALLLSIALIDLTTQKIPNRLVALIPLLALPHLSFNPVVILISLLLFALTDIGAGDIKLALACSAITSHIQLPLFFIGFCLGVLIAVFPIRSWGRIPLAPAIALAFMANI